MTATVKTRWTAGETVLMEFDLLNLAGVSLPCSAFDVAAVWRDTGAVVPLVPVCTSTGTTTWLVVAPTDGLGGRAPTLRATAIDPVTGYVYVVNKVCPVDP